MSNKRVSITTIDNPYDPFDQFNQWFLFDVEKGYNTCSYLGRIVQLYEGMTQKEEDEACLPPFRSRSSRNQPYEEERR